MLIAVIVLLKLLGVLGGGTMFAFGIAGENGVLTAGGMVLVVLAALVGPRRREPLHH